MWRILQFYFLLGISPQKSWVVYRAPDKSKNGSSFSKIFEWVVVKRTEVTVHSSKRECFVAQYCTKMYRGLMLLLCFAFVHLSFSVHYFPFSNLSFSCSLLLWLLIVHLHSLSLQLGDCMIGNDKVEITLFCMVVLAMVISL